MYEKKGHKSVFGIFNSRYSVDAAVDQLKSAGFRNQDISVLMPTKEGTKDFAHTKDTKAPEGATTGATAGAIVGGGLGWLAGIGALAIPGIGPFVAAGPIMAALAGAGVGGSLGGVTGALIGMGIPEYEAKRYEGFVKDGGILLSVHVDDSDWQKKAKELLERAGARDIATAGEEGTDSKKDGSFKDNSSFKDKAPFSKDLPYGKDAPLTNDSAYRTDPSGLKVDRMTKTEDERKNYGV